MKASFAVDDYSTYKFAHESRPDGVCAAATKKAAWSVNVIPEPSVTLPPASATFADCSVSGRGMSAPGFPSLSLIAPPPPVPRPFLEAYEEMLCYRHVEDGRGDISSARIPQNAADLALEFLALLPADLMPPEASASGDGTVDWYWRNGRRAAAVTFHPNGRVAYFSMTESGSVKGTFKFSGSIPGELVESLRQL